MTGLSLQHVFLMLVLASVVHADDACSSAQPEEGPEMTHTSQLIQVKHTSHETKVDIESGEEQQSSDSATPHHEGEDFVETQVPLQNIRTLESSSGTCLNFLHIPKNAGSTIEDFVVKQTGRVGWGEKDSQLNRCSISNNKPFWGSSRKRHAYGCRISDAANRQGDCSVWHVPPVYDAVVAASYADCQTFCVVRNPLTRAISQHIYDGGGCNVSSFVRTIAEKSRELQVNPFVEDCHWVDQTTYIGRDSTKYCQHVLKFENLEAEFNALMNEFGLPLTLSQATHRLPGDCDLSAHLQDIPSAAFDWIEKYYAEDYVNFGYQKLQQLQNSVTVKQKNARESDDTLYQEAKNQQKATQLQKQQSQQKQKRRHVGSYRSTSGRTAMP